MIIFVRTPQRRKNFSILSKAFKNYAPSEPFKNKAAEIRVEYIGGQFWTQVPPPPLKIYLGGGRVVSAPLMTKVMSTLTVKHFKLSINFLLTAFILL